MNKKVPSSLTPVEDSSVRIHVLDTSVLMSSPSALFSFQEHDICLPMQVLSEIDKGKKGHFEAARNARESARNIESVSAEPGADITVGVSLSRLSQGAATGELFICNDLVERFIPKTLPKENGDNQIIGTVLFLKKKFPGRTIILVSNDINMRSKARACHIKAEEYATDRVIKDTSLLYSGTRRLDESFWSENEISETMKSGGKRFYTVKGPFAESVVLGEYVYYEGDAPLYAVVTEISRGVTHLATIRDYSLSKNSVSGITANNREQNFALNALMDPDIDFVSLMGDAGTGKTLLALAAGLAQTMEPSQRKYNKIIMTRATVPIGGEDIGYLPGTEVEKMTPWMGALMDNLEVVMPNQFGGNGNGNGRLTEFGRGATQDILEKYISIRHMGFMRGRTFQEKFLIIDEAQNLTVDQARTMITRAGNGTKVVFLGNIAQIDTPYVIGATSGITFVAERMKNWDHARHVILPKGERSRLANYANQVLQTV